ncbi:hypothetical protein Tco_1224555, partial [Tanacetum coccineum]
ALPSLDYVPGPEEPNQAPLSPEFVPEPIYLEFMLSEDEVFPAEEHPLPAAVSPTADSPRYIAYSDPKEDEEDLEEDPEEDPIDYPANGGEDDDDDDESSDDDEDDDDDVEEEKEEEEEPALTDSVPPHVHRGTARMSIRDDPPTPFWPEVEISILLAISSPLSPWSSLLPQIPSPPLPVSSPVPVSPPPLPASPTYPLGYRAAMIWLRAESPSTSHPLLLPSPIVLPHTRASVAMMRAVAPSTYILASRSEAPPSGTPPLLPIPLHTPSPPLHLPSTDCRAGVSKVGESSSAPTTRPTGGFRADYGFVATLDDEIKRDPEREDDRSLMSGRLNMLYRDRRAYASTALLMERDARLSRKAWVQSMDASDTASSEVRALRTIVLAQKTEITGLRAADRTRQA